MSQEAIKSVWPQWNLTRELGKGSYGTVYQAKRNDSTIETYSAIKDITVPQDHTEVKSLMSEGMSDVEVKTYFEGIVTDFGNEIALMEQLKGHPNIVGIEDYSIIENKESIGWNIIVRMELLKPFDEYSSENKMSESEVIKLGCDMCNALITCEKKGIVHRDIKPENIFANEFGNFKLGDFGIAKKFESMSSSHSQKGTFNYMAPEVASGSHYDGRVDIYSLGIVLYKLLNRNNLPFLDDNTRLDAKERKRSLERRLSGEMPPMPCEAGNAVASVIMKAISYRPEDRFPDASSFRNALLAAEQGIGVPLMTTAAPVQNFDENATVYVNRINLGTSNNSVSFNPSAVPQQPVYQQPYQPQTPSGNNDGKKKKKTGLIIGIIAGALALVLAVVLILVFAGKDKEGSSGKKSESGSNQKKQSELEEYLEEHPELKQEMLEELELSDAFCDENIYADGNVMVLDCNVDIESLLGMEVTDEVREEFAFLLKEEMISYDGIDTFNGVYEDVQSELSFVEGVRVIFRDDKGILCSVDYPKY